MSVSEFLLKRSVLAWTECNGVKDAEVAEGRKADSMRRIMSYLKF